MILINEFMSPAKQGSKSPVDRDMGTTQLRKTIFKKHYKEKIR